MAHFLQKLVGNPKRAKQARRDEKIRRLYRVGAALLAKADYEQISVATLARDAKVSVGAFYGRFAHKNNFISSLIASTFRMLGEQTETKLSAAHCEGATKTKLIQGVVHHVVAQLCDDRNAGILRAAIKLGTSEPSAWTEIQAYRGTVAECAVKVMETLSDRSSPENVRAAMQVVCGTVIDAALLDTKPLRLGSGQMVSELSELVARYLGVAGKHEWEKVTIDRGRIPSASEHGVDPDTTTKEVLRELPSPQRKRRRAAVRRI